MTCGASQQTCFQAAAERSRSFCHTPKPVACGWCLSGGSGTCRAAGNRAAGQQPAAVHALKEDRCPGASEAVSCSDAASEAAAHEHVACLSSTCCPAKVHQYQPSWCQFSLPIYLQVLRVALRCFGNMQHTVPSTSYSHTTWAAPQQLWNIATPSQHSCGTVSIHQDALPGPPRQPPSGPEHCMPVCSSCPSLRGGFTQRSCCAAQS